MCARCFEVGQLRVPFVDRAGACEPTSTGRGMLCLRTGRPARRQSADRFDCILYRAAGAAGGPYTRFYRYRAHMAWTGRYLKHRTRSKGPCGAQTAVRSTPYGRGTDKTSCTSPTHPLPYRVYNRTYRPTDVGRAARFSSIAYLAQYWLVHTLPPDRRTGPATAQDLKTTCARTRTDGGLGDFC